MHVGDEQRPVGPRGRAADARAGRVAARRSASRWAGSRPARRRGSIGARIDFSRFAEERGDDPIVPFSFLSDRIARAADRLSPRCTRPTRVHDLVRANIGRSPLYNGQITGIGPRYCPSLEDKVMRFPDKERHQIFLEPEGLDVDEIYVNGLSMSLPRDVQDAIVHALPGLEDARDPAARVCGRVRLHPADRARSIARDEAASGPVSRRPDQRHVGLRRGRGAGTDRRAQRRARGARRGAPVVLERDEAYIGILVDDLVTRGCLEPYRMFTSRAEHRLRLRIDNADLRLTPIGRAAGLVDDERWARFEARRARLERTRARADDRARHDRRRTRHRRAGAGAAGDDDRRPARAGLRDRDHGRPTRRSTRRRSRRRAGIAAI